MLDLFALFGIVLFFVGAVLFVNGMGALGHADGKGGAFLNFFVGLLTLGVNVVFILARPFGEPDSYYYAATGLLFSATYLWNGYNVMTGHDGRAFGWFCFFVAATAVPVAIRAFSSDWRFGTFWASWGALWFAYFLLLSFPDRSRGLARPTAYATVAVAILTCWVPGFFILIGRW